MTSLNVENSNKMTGIFLYRFQVLIALSVNGCPVKLQCCTAVCTQSWRLDQRKLDVIAPRVISSSNL